MCRLLAMNHSHFHPRRMLPPPKHYFTKVRRCWLVVTTPGATAMRVLISLYISNKNPLFLLYAVFRADCNNFVQHKIRIYFVQIVIKIVFCKKNISDIFCCRTRMFISGIWSIKGNRAIQNQQKWIISLTQQILMEYRWTQIDDFFPDKNVVCLQHFTW